MKKSIGLTANTSDFRPNLPQTKHLNYFMGTNPIYMANGGDVKAGIPNYPDVNVTRGFLPAALGFDNGGEADKDVVTKVYDFIFGYFKNVLGMDDETAKDETEEVIKDPEKVQEIITQIPIGKSPSFDDIETGKFEVMPPSTLTPKDTVTTTPTGPSFDDISTGKFEGMPPAELPTEIIPEVNNESVIDKPTGPSFDDISTGKFEGAPPSGISSITPDAQPPSDAVDVTGQSTKKWDLNNDGKVDYKDLFIAIQSGSQEAIDAIKEIISGAIEGWEKETIEPDLPKISPEQRERDEEDKQRGIETITPDKETKTDKGGIAELPKVSEEQIKRDKEDERTGLGVEEQNLLKKASTIAGGGDPDTPDDPTTKKDAPAWALPLMSAGFAMMASKSPNFLQALGEGGQEGIKTLTAQQEGKLEKEKSEAQIKKDLAWADYYTAGGASGKPTIITDSQGRKIYAVLDKKTNTWKPITTASGKPQYVVRSIPEIEKYLATIHGPAWIAMSVDDRQKLVEAEINKDLGIAITNVQSSTGTEDTGPGVFGKIWEGIQEGVTAKDGGIVSLRR